MINDINVSLIEKTEEGSKTILSKRVRIPVIRLNRLVDGSVSGERWLRKLRAETDVRESKVAEIITVSDRDMIGGRMFYGLLRGDEYGGYSGSRFGGVLEEVPDSARMVDINPNDLNGMRHLRETRRGVSSPRLTGLVSYYLLPPSEDIVTDNGYIKIPDNNLGYLVGELDLDDFSSFSAGGNPSESVFPLYSFADVVYPSKEGREFVVRLEQRGSYPTYRDK